MGYCDKLVSRKIRLLSLMATISVVVIHTNAFEGNKAAPILWWIGNLIGYVQRWAVPFFFVVSGFFLHRFYACNPHGDFLGKLLIKKTKSLVLPYLLWGGAYGTLAMTILVFGVAKSHGANNPYGCTIFGHEHGLALFDSIIGLTKPPLNGALWYLRVLIIATFSSPLWMLTLVKKHKICLITALTLITAFPLSVIDEVKVEFPFVAMVSPNALGYILLGVFASLEGADRFNVSKRLALVSFMLSLACLFCPLPYLGSNLAVPCVVRVIHRVTPLFFFIGVWKFGDLLVRVLPDSVDGVFQYCFWIYCMHHPVTGYTSALFHAVLGHSLLSDCLYQALGWLFVLMVCFSCGLFVRRVMPSVFSVMTGGRMNDCRNSMS